MRYWIVFTYILFFFGSSLPNAFAQVGATDSGLAEKALRQSQQKPFQKPEIGKPEIIVIDDSRDIIDPGAGPAFFVKKIETEGNTLFDDATLAPILNIEDGIEMTLGILALFAQELTAFYSQKGYFLTKAYVPKQEVKDGIVKIKINEGRVNKISVSGNKKVDAEALLKRMGRVKKEAILKEQVLERALLDINDIPGVKVRSLLRPGKVPGTSDLVLEVTESEPYTFSFDADNFGSQFTGAERAGISASTGNLLTLGDQAFFRGVRSDLDQESSTFSYSYPLNDLGTRTLKFSYTYSKQSLGKSLAALSAGGRTNLFNAEVAESIYRTKDASLKWRVGYDFKSFKNFQLGVDSSRDKIRDFYAGLGGSFQDSYQGRNFLDLKIQRGFFGTDQESDLQSRVDGDAKVTIIQTNNTRFQATPWFGSYVIFKANGQLASDRALSPDLFAVGGYGTVRGFPLAEQSGDWGYNLAAEYIIPFPSKLPVGIGKLTLDQMISFSGFIEHGKVFVRDPQAGDNRVSITGVGFGVQINIPKDGTCCDADFRPPINFNVSYGLPMNGPVPSDASSGTIYVSGSIGLF